MSPTEQGIRELQKLKYFLIHQANVVSQLQTPNLHQSTKQTLERLHTQYAEEISNSEKALMAILENMDRETLDKFLWTMIRSL